MDAQMFVLIIERFFMTESRKVYGPFAEEKRSEIETILRLNGFSGGGQWWTKTGGYRATINDLRKTLDEIKNVW